jgi:branched-chain amino acid transport system substrate-binding protein
MKLRMLGIAGVVGLLAAIAVVPTVAQSPGAAGTLKIGITLPLSGGARADGGPAERGAQLAIDQANEAGGIGGYMLESVVLDHAVDGRYNEVQGATDMQTLVADPEVIAAVGPYNSAVARVQIPISNTAGLLQCSPANTAEGLTKPEFGALEFRSAFPDRINYIRVATTDDIQGPAMAVYAYETLGLRNMLIVDDVTTFGTGVANNFQTQFESLGGTTAARVEAPAPTEDFNAVVTEAATQNPDGVYYGGVVTSGANFLLLQLRQQGLTIPFLGPDGIKNGSGADDGALINLVGAETAVPTYGTVAAIGDFPAKAEFDAAYAEHFASAPDFQTPGAYSGPAHACATVVIESLRAFLEANPDADPAAIREGVRAYAADPANSFETVLGNTSFDVNGDNTQKFISFYEVDPALLDGAGDWTFIGQIDFGEVEAEASPGAEGEASPGAEGEASASPAG